MTTATKTKAKVAGKPASASKPKSSFGGLSALDAIAKPAAAKSKTKVYPGIPDPDGEIAQIADTFASELDQFKSLDASVKTYKAELTSLGRQLWHSYNHGKADPVSSVEACGKKNTILVTFQNRYPGSADPEVISKIIGEQETERLFYQSFALKIDGDKIPADDANEIIGKISAILNEAGCGDALSATAVVKPTKEYHAARFQFSAEQNADLDRLVPPVAVVRKKS